MLIPEGLGVCKILRPAPPSLALVSDGVELVVSVGVELGLDGVNLELVSEGVELGVSDGVELLSEGQLDEVLRSRRSETLWMVPRPPPPNGAAAPCE
ncbi:unnamed protein product [Gadus morhua 'NCC']